MSWTMGISWLTQKPLGLRLDWIPLKRFFSIINQKRVSNGNFPKPLEYIGSKDCLDLKNGLI